MKEKDRLSNRQQQLVAKRKPVHEVRATERPERQKDPEAVWADFKGAYALTDEQLQQFRSYEQLLVEWNQTRNLTALTNLSAIVNQHFKDSLAVISAVDFTGISTVCDVGSGAGFPGLPLKIMMPQLRVLLIEVCKKKQEFLAAVISALGLRDVEIVDIDWRTFLRKTDEPIDLFLSKAALDEVELARMFRMTSPYRDRKLIYWVSDEWVCNPKVAEFVRKTVPYSISHKQRKLVVLAKQ